jgi:hypothetical protein
MQSSRGLFAAVVLAGCTAFARGEETPEKPTTVALSEVKAFPEAYRRVPFDLELVYHGPRNVYNPFFTIFEPSNWANFAAWPGDAPLFRRESYIDDHPFFYVERRAEATQRAVMAMKPYTWFTASCIVRSTAQGRAWIEVLSIKSTGAALDPTDLRHLVRAHSLASSGQFERSLVEHSLARLLNVPPRFVARCQLEEGRVALAANQPERAMAALTQAWPQLQDDKQVAALLDRASAELAAQRQQDVAKVPAPESGPTPRPSPPVDPAVPPAPVPTEPDAQKPADPSPAEAPPKGESAPADGRPADEEVLSPESRPPTPTDESGADRTESDDDDSNDDATDGGTDGGDEGVTEDGSDGG